MDRLENMIRDLLDASRIRAGESLSLEFQECDLDWLIREVADEFNATYEGRFKISSSGECEGYWNYNGLRRLLENLSNNAIKYGLKDAPVTISLVQNTETVTLKVHNEGKAIAPEEMDILFQQYRRSRSSDNEVGWGLGLTVVKGVVDAHKGSIEVISENKLGTTFAITLPRNSKPKI